MSKRKLWSDDELSMLKTCDGMTYNQICSLFPYRTKNSVISKAVKEGLIVTDERDLWTPEEDRKLINYSNSKTLSELIQLFQNRSEDSIVNRCRRLNIKFKQSKVEWSNNETQFLIDNYYNSSMDFLVHNLNDKTKYDIRFKVKNLGLKKSSNISSIIDTNSLAYSFKVYKDVLDNNGRLIIKNYSHLPILFRYYLRKNNIPMNREYLTENYIIGKLLKDAKLKPTVKRKYSNYFEFIKTTFPSYNLEEWEIKSYDVSTGYWDSYHNRMRCIDKLVNKYTQYGLIDCELDLMKISMDKLKEIFPSSLVYYFNKDVFYEYLDYKKLTFNCEDIKYYNDIRFDSLEEMSVYKFIHGLGVNIKKVVKKEMLYNPKFNESYIPDFKINDEIYVEYYGLYRKGNKLDKYIAKTHRKNDFYKDCGFKFIDLYPKDLEDGFNGVRDKLLNHNLIK